MNQIQIPVKPFATFIDAASSWLTKINTMKVDLELRIFKEGNDLHVSVGADSNYIEAILDADVSFLETPIYLDMNYLAQYTFDTESLALVIPIINPENQSKIEKRAQFKAPGQNFRIPIRPGIHWERNEQDLNQFEDTPGFSLTQELMKEIYPYLQLPDSFKIDREKTLPQLVFEKTIGPGFQCYTWDGFGAFWHTFNCEGFMALNSFSKLLIPYEFLMPYKKVEEFSSMRFKQSSKLSMLELFDIPGFKKFRWLQPRYIKSMEDIPTAIQQIRAKAESCLTFETQEFLKNVEKATVFLQGKAHQEVPLSFSIIQDSYTLTTRTPDSEMSIDGKAKSETSSHKNVQFQAACLRDYLRCLDKTNDFNMEIFRETITFYQELKNDKGKKMILYWTPVYLR